MSRSSHPRPRQPWLPEGTGAGLWLTLALASVAGCDNTLGTVDLYFRSSPVSQEDPLLGWTELRLGIDVGGSRSWEQDIVYTGDLGSEVSFPEVPAGESWVVSVDVMKGDRLTARGQSVPFVIQEGTNRLDLYVALIHGFSQPSRSEFPGTPRGGHSAVTLDDGGVVLVGGSTTLLLGELSVENPVPLDGSAEAVVEEVDLFDPTAGRLAQGGSCPDAPGTHQLCLSTARLDASIGRTPGGDVLVMGGEGATQVQRLPRGELTFAVGDEVVLPSQRRRYATLVEAPSGALLIGGQDSLLDYLATGVLFGQAGEVPRDLGEVAGCPRARATAAVAGGDLLLFGGVDGSGLSQGYAVVPLDPDVRAGTCTELSGSGIEARVGAAAAVVDDRFVVVTGGLLADGTASDEVDVFDSATDRLCPAGSMLWPRHLHASATLPDGRILVLGGVLSTDWIDRSYEILDLGLVINGMLERGEGFPCDGSVQVVSPSANTLEPGRIAATATALGNGMVLVAGGFDESGQALSDDQQFLIFVP